MTQARLVERVRAEGRRLKAEGWGSKFLKPRTSDLEPLSYSHVTQVPLFALVARYSTIASRIPVSNEE